MMFRTNFGGKASFAYRKQKIFTQDDGTIDTGHFPELRGLQKFLEENVNFVKVEKKKAEESDPPSGEPEREAEEKKAAKTAKPNG